MDGLLTRYEEQLVHDHSASSRSAIPVRYGLFFMGLGAGLTLVVQGAFQSLQFAHQSSQELARPWATSEALKTPSQYVATQLHGFEIFTFPGSEDDGCPRESLFDENSNCYLGLEDVYADANRRVDIMLQAVDSAHAAGKTNHSNSVLKVFLAPEFFFAPIVRGGKQESCTSTIGMRGCGWLVFKSYISSIDFLDFPESELEKRGDDVRYTPPCCVLSHAETERMRTRPKRCMTSSALGGWSSTGTRSALIPTGCASVSRSASTTRPAISKRSCRPRPRPWGSSTLCRSTCS